MKFCPTTFGVVVPPLPRSLLAVDVPCSWTQRPQICSADPLRAPVSQQFRSRSRLPSGECSKKSKFLGIVANDRECGSCRESCMMQKSSERAACLGHAHTSLRSPRWNVRSEYKAPFTPSTITIKITIKPRSHQAR